MEDVWNEIDEHLGVVYSNLGICCQEYCHAAEAIYNLEQAMEKLVDLRLKTKE